MRKAGKKKKRTSKKNNECMDCKAGCCRYIVVEVDPPVSKNEYEELRWIIAHKKVYLECVDKEWYVCFRTKCEHLDKDSHCSVYASRPAICRKHDPESCDKTGLEEEVDMRFMNLRELDGWLEKNVRMFSKRKKRAAKNTSRPAAKDRRIRH